MSYVLLNLNYKMSFLYLCIHRQEISEDLDSNDDPLTGKKGIAVQNSVMFSVKE
jgi:hypothetical protein